MTLVENVVVTFVVVAFLAIALRFMPRDERGARRFPRVIDESIGMSVVRGLRGLLGRRGDALEEPSPALVEPTAEEIAYRIGDPSVRGPILPTRIVVARAPAHGQPLSRPAPAIPVVARPPALRRAQARPASALALQRRMAGTVATAVLAIAALGVVLVPRSLDGGVLSATGTPGPVSNGLSGAPSADAPAAASPEPAGTDDSSTIAPAIVTPTSVRPAPTARAATPRSTPRSTPRPTPRSTPKPPPTPQPGPSSPISTPPPRPTPVETPIPTPTPPPPPTPTPTAVPTPTPVSPAP